MARAVGIRRASLVYYFRNKQELYDQVEAEIFVSLQAETERRLASCDGPWLRILAVLDAWLDFMVDRPTVARIITRNVADIAPRASNPGEFSETMLGTVEAIIREGQAAGLFAPIRPQHFINILGAAVLLYVCNAEQYGRGRIYRPEDAAEKQAYRQLLHAVARTVLVPSGH